MLDLFREIGQTMRSNRLRTILTGISVSWGVFMLILLLGMAKGLVNAFEANQTSESMGKINVWNGITSRPWRGYSDGRYIRQRNSDLQPVVENSHGLIASGSAFATNDTAKIHGPATLYPAASWLYIRRPSSMRESTCRAVTSSTTSTWSCAAAR